MSRMRTIMPKRSSFAYCQAARLGRRLARMRPPSSGRMGTRFRNMNTRLTKIPASAIKEKKNVPLFSGSSTETLRSSAQKSAMTRFAPGPAAATSAMCLRGLRNAE